MRQWRAVGKLKWKPAQQSAPQAQGKKKKGENVTLFPLRIVFAELGIKNISVIFFFLICFVRFSFFVCVCGLRFVLFVCCLGLGLNFPAQESQSLHINLKVGCCVCWVSFL